MLRVLPWIAAVIGSVSVAAVTTAQPRTYKLPNGCVLQGLIERTDGARVLLRTSFPDGDGLAWAKADALTDITGQPTHADKLEQAKKLLDAGRVEEASAVLDALVRGGLKSDDPVLTEAKRIYARALRRQWQFKAAHTLMESAVSHTAVPDAAMLKEAAEIAVLSGARRSADKALSRLRSAADKDEALKAYVNDLRTQLQGGAPVTAAGAPPVERPIAEIAAERAAYDPKAGDCAFTSQLADAVKTTFNAGFPGMVHRVQISTDASQTALAVYQSGGTEDDLVSSMRRVTLLVGVDKDRWLTFFDWQKRVEAWRAVSLAAQKMPRVMITCYVLQDVVSGDSDNPIKSGTKDLARAVYNPNASAESLVPLFSVELLTRENRDFAREASIKAAELEKKKPLKGR